MKKITFLIFVLTGLFGFSQTFPLDFEDPADAGWGAFNTATVSVVDDGSGSNNVLQLTSNGVDFDGAALALAAGLVMSDDGNNTITFTFDPQDNLGAAEVRTHLFKLEGGTGGPAVAELYFDSTGPDSQTISLDFGPGLGTYSTVVLFMDSGAGNTATGAYWIDDIAGGTNAGASCTDGVKNGDETNIDCGGTCPNTCPPDAPNPTTPDGEVVLSLINDIPGYTNAYPVEGEFGTRKVEDLGAEMDEVTRMDFSLDAWGQFQNAKPDLSGAGFLNFSYYAPNLPPGAGGHEFYIMLGSGTGDKFYTLKTDGSGDGILVFDSWQNVSVPMSFFTAQGFEPSNAAGGGLLVWKLGTPSAAFTTIVYFDNIYFRADPLSTNEFSIRDLNVYPNPTNDSWTIKSSKSSISSIRVYDILGKQVSTMTPNTNEVDIDATNFKSGIYFAKIESETGSKTVKLIRQ